jgi:hypothetical protein
MNRAKQKRVALTLSKMEGHMHLILGIILTALLGPISATAMENPNGYDAEVQSSEPAYCDLNSLRKLEVKALSGKLERLHAFQIGNVMVAGLAVGHSSVRDVATMATYYGKAGPADGYCTWYINDGNGQAKKAFNWRSVDRPNSSGNVKQYISKLGPALDQNKNNMVSCAEKYGYIALGCDGMKHRGPTLFGMLLSYSGCSPQRADKIVTTIWGTNGTNQKVRQTIMQKAYEQGLAHAQQSQILQNQFLAN